MDGQSNTRRSMFRYIVPVRKRHLREFKAALYSHKAIVHVRFLCFGTVLIPPGGYQEFDCTKTQFLNRKVRLPVYPVYYTLMLQAFSGRLQKFKPLFENY